MAKPPRPTVSTIALSPMSGLASFSRVAGEVEPDRHLDRRREPVVAGAGDADAEVGAVAAHGGDDRRALDAARRIGDRLAHGHADVEEELVVAADEVEAALEHLRCRSSVRASAGASRRSSRLEQATLRWCISSPIDRPRAISAFSGMPPMSRSARPSAGPSSSRSQARRPSTSASLPPKRMTLPRPSLIAQ